MALLTHDRNPSPAALPSVWVSEHVSNVSKGLTSSTGEIYSTAAILAVRYPTSSLFSLHRSDSPVLFLSHMNSTPPTVRTSAGAIAAEAFNEAIATEMRLVCGLQIDCVRCLLWPYRTEAPKVLAVQATGKGKSLCMQTAGTLLGGITLVIVPLLELGADKVTKILRMNQVYGIVKGYHLDEIKTPE
eukprot:scaffold5015_cov51-Attheya_sp.AAC.6